MANSLAGAIYMLLLLLVVSVLVAVRVNGKRGRKNSAFTAFCILVLGWLAADFAILLIFNVAVNVYVWSIVNIFVAFAPVALFAVTFGFFLPKRKLPAYVIVLICIVPAVTGLLSLAPGAHSLFRNVEYVAVWPRVVEYSMGAWFVPHTISSYLLTWGSCFIVIYYGFIKNGNRSAAVLYSFALLATAVGSVTYLLNLLPADINTTSMGFAVCVILIHLAVSDNRYSKRFRMFNTFRSRITFPSLIGMFVMFSCVLFIVGITLRGLTDDFEADRVTAAQQTVRAQLDAYEQLTANAAFATGDSAELVRLMHEGDRNAIWQFAYDRKRHFGADEIIIINADGVAVARSHMRDSYGDDVSDAPEAGPGSITFYTPVPGAYMVMTSASPITDGDIFLGVAVVNRVIGYGDVISRVEDIFGVEVYIRDDIAYGNSGDVFDIGISGEAANRTVGTSMRNIIIVASFGSAAISIVMFLLITKALKPLESLAKNIKNVAAGNVNVNIDSEKIPPDEIGALTLDVLGLVGVIKNMVDDLNIAYEAYMVSGDSKYRIDMSKYQNSFREIVEHTNSSYDEIEAAIMSTVHTLEQISVGDFDADVYDKDMIGDWKALPDATRSVIENLKSVSAEVTAMIDAAAVKGDLAFHISADKYEGDWRKIMLGLNSIAEAVDAPIVEIRNSLAALKEGGFDTFVKGDYAGDFLAIKNDTNEMIKNMSAYINEIAVCLGEVEKGNLTRHIDIFFNGDFYKIKESIKNIIKTLHKTVSEISVASDQVLSGANQISESANELSEGVQEQASSVQELNFTVETITRQTQRNADNALAANELSNKSTVVAREGNDAMGQMVEAMSKIKESSRGIDKIVKTIQDIAFQTNLLALNASVEAARAGEHGKGFAVVADEVRSLAGRSQTAATETTALIRDSISRVDAGSAVAGTTAESLDAIVAGVSEVLEVISGISAASKEQAEAIANISTGIEQISNVTQANSAISEEAASASEELNSQAELLKQLVAFFKL
ncbi:MAG: methyl-accepting chemotaxis protein [Defluviitaleaceae bacterium]|nr:methyl-accepting chemotaxis protein [Defluviitaleaceae bacterium]